MKSIHFKDKVDQK